MKFGRMQAGLLVTTLYVAGVAALVVLRWKEFNELPLNALGDFAAGAASPIAFLWLVLGYFQQGDELALNTRALEEQARELHLSVQAQESLAQATREQTALAERQARDAAETHKRHIQPLLELEAVAIHGSPTTGLKVNFKLTNHGGDCGGLAIASTYNAVPILHIDVGAFQRNQDFGFELGIDRFDDAANSAIDVDFFYVDQQGEYQRQNCGMDIYWDEEKQAYERGGITIPGWKAEDQ